MKIFKSFIKQFSILVAVVLLLSILIDLFVPKIKISPMYPYILIFLYLITLGIFKMIAKSMENRLSKFANTYIYAAMSSLSITFSKPARSDLQSEFLYSSLPPARSDLQSEFLCSSLPPKYSFRSSLPQNLLRRICNPSPLTGFQTVIQFCVSLTLE